MKSTNKQPRKEGKNLSLRQTFALPLPIWSRACTIFANFQRREWRGKISREWIGLFKDCADSFRGFVTGEPKSQEPSCWSAARCHLVVTVCQQKKVAKFKNKNAKTLIDIHPSTSWSASTPRRLAPFTVNPLWPLKKPQELQLSKAFLCEM